jgi:hypothetical protein
MSAHQVAHEAGGQWIDRVPPGFRGDQGAGDREEPPVGGRDVFSEVVAGGVLELALVALPAGEGDGRQIVSCRPGEIGKCRALDRPDGRRGQAEVLELVAHVGRHRDRALGVASRREAGVEPTEQGARQVCHACDRATVV